MAPRSEQCASYTCGTFHLPGTQAENQLSDAERVHRRCLVDKNERITERECGNQRILVNGLCVVGKVEERLGDAGFASDHSHMGMATRGCLKVAPEHTDFRCRPNSTDPALALTSTRTTSLRTFE